MSGDEVKLTIILSFSHYLGIGDMQETLIMAYF